MAQSIVKIKLALNHLAGDNNQSLDNEFIIDSLIKNYQIPFIDINSVAIKPLNYELLNEYFKEGYFIFRDHYGVDCYAINNIAVIKDKNLDLRKGIKVYLIRKQDLHQILESNFSKQNSQWAIDYLGSISASASAKNVNYKKIVVGFLMLFILGRPFI